MDGQWISYYPNGDIRTLHQYAQEEPVGVWKEFKEDGSLASETDYGGQEAQVNKLASELFDKAMDGEQEEERSRGIKK